MVITTAFKAAILLLALFMTLQVISTIVLTHGELIAIEKTEIGDKELARFWMCAALWSAFYFICNI
jgi:hypothetical protein